MADHDSHSTTSTKKPFAKLFDASRQKKKTQQQQKPQPKTFKEPSIQHPGSSPIDNNNHHDQQAFKKKKKKRPPKRKRLTDDEKDHVQEDKASSSSNPKNSNVRPPQNNNNNNNNNNKKRPKLSPEMLQISQQLKEYSQRKQLTQALDLYWDKQQDGIPRDGFHACIALDCCARCGAMEEADKILDKLQQSGEPISIETNTSAIKGYAHAGNLAKAFGIFQDMYQSQQQKPNVRTLNTLLRGCLWTAASIDAKDDIVGGVVTSEAALKLCGGKKKKKKTKTMAAMLDISSYEYTITLLCQALRMEEVTQRIQEFQQAYNVKVDGTNIQCDNNTSVLESMTIAYLHLCRAHALLGNKHGALSTFQIAREAIQQSKKAQSSATSGKAESAKSAYGEKRGWKTNNNDDASNNRRMASNAKFRGHRLNEMERDLHAIMDACNSPNYHGSKSILAERMVLGLFYFSGGGTTKQDDSHSNSSEEEIQGLGRTLRRQVLNASWISFGLKEALKDKIKEWKLRSDFIRVKDAGRVYRFVGNVQQAIQDDGFLDFATIFSDKKKAKPIDIELGAGHGDWIVNQAANMPDRNHVAVELRADRVHSIFCKGMLHSTGPLKNLCVVGDDCHSFLNHRVKPNSISTIFANHPEPPTQVFGKYDDELEAVMNGGPEPSHMLDSKALLAAEKCLCSSSESSSNSSPGRVVIVTDNYNYARLLCATVVKMKRHRNSSLASCRIDSSASDLREIDPFPNGSSKESRHAVTLWEGQPCSAIGHSSQTTTKGKTSSYSYFDGLWKTGAGTHASQKERYILALERQNGSES